MRRMDQEGPELFDEQDFPLPKRITSPQFVSALFRRRRKTTTYEVCSDTPFSPQRAAQSRMVESEEANRPLSSNGTGKLYSVGLAR